MDIAGEIMSNPEGGTVALEREGMSGAHRNLPPYGYFVGGIVSPLVLTGTDSAEEREESLGLFVSYLSGSTMNVRYLGWWTDEETGHLWVDGTSWHATEFEAGRVGRERREIAIYDIARQRELRLAYVDGE